MDYQKYLETLPREVASLQATLGLAFAFGLCQMCAQGLLTEEQANQALLLTHSGRVRIVVELGPEPRPE